MLIDDLQKQFQQNELPIVFSYDGQEYSGFNRDFERLSSTSEQINRGECHTTLYRHIPSGTLWTVTIRHYPKYNALEWQAEIYAPEKTGIFSDIRYQLNVPGTHGRLLGNYGDEGGGYKEFDFSLDNERVYQEAETGRPTHYVFPYYRLETDQNKITTVLSWQGAWFSQFEQAADEVNISMGQKNICAYLEKGEGFRLPLMLIQEYHSDPANAWRRFYIDCNMPLVKGERVKPLLAAFNGVCAGLNNDIVRRVKETYDAHGIDYDFWWFDAGWGTDGTGPHSKSGWWYHGVNFEMNFEAFPDGLEWLGKALKREGRDFMLWFEPEVVRTPPEHLEEFFKAHPQFKREWFLGTFQKEWCGIILTAQLMDLGNAECLKWLEERIFEVMDRAEANIFRIDFNIPPAQIWAEHDRPDRKGITENHYCAGYLQLLKDIQSRYPGILMDSCASGGGRNDLETLRLMLPLHYTDYQDIAPEDTNSFIYMQQVLYRWFPYFKGWINAFCVSDKYAARAAYNPSVALAIRPEEMDDLDFDKLKEDINEWYGINKAYMGNYYELEKASNNNTDIKAFMFFNKEENLGFVMVFCPENCTQTAYRAVLQGLEAQKIYSLEDIDTHNVLKMQGDLLCSQGIELNLAPRTARLIKISGEC